MKEFIGGWYSAIHLTYVQSSFYFEVSLTVSLRSDLPDIQLGILGLKYWEKMQGVKVCVAKLTVVIFSLLTSSIFYLAWSQQIINYLVPAFKLA